MRSKNQNYTDMGKIHWKKALEDGLIEKSKLVAKQPKGLIYGKSEGIIKHTNSIKKVYCEIVVDDDYLACLCQELIFPYFKDKEQVKERIDKCWVDTRKVELLDGLEKLKQQAKELNINLEDLL